MITPQELVETGLRTAADGGADGAMVLVHDTSHVDVRFACNTTTTNGIHWSRAVTVVALADGAVGTARRSGVVGGDGVAALARAALADARDADPADDAWALVEPGQVRPGRAFSLDPERTGASALEGVLSSLAGAFTRSRSRRAVLAGFAEHEVETTYLGTSTGVRLSHAQPTGSVNLVGRTGDGTASAWVGVPGVDADLGVIEEQVWRRLDWARHRVELDAGRYEVLLPPSAVADMMAMLAFDGLSGQDAEDGRTVFSKEGGGTRLGETVTPLPFTLSSDPGRPGIECLPFVANEAGGWDQSVFDNGLPIGRVDWLDRGVLSRLRHHRAAAARAGVAPAPFVDNLVLECATAAGGTVDDMVGRTERGLLLTCLWYIREVDPATLLVTGLTRDGVYLVEDGAVVGSANNFRFNESPLDLLVRATEVGAPERTLAREFGEGLNRALMPALRIPDFNMSTVSRAS